VSLNDVQTTLIGEDKGY